MLGLRAYDRLYWDVVPAAGGQVDADAAGLLARLTGPFAWRGPNATGARRE